MDATAIFAALKGLDVGNDNHWTADGLPRLDTVKMLAANPALNRDMVLAAAPGFTRANATDYTLPTAAAQATAPVAPDTGAENAAIAAGAGAAPQVSGENANAAATFSNDPAKQPEVADGDGSAEDEVAALEAELAKADAAIQEVLEAVDMVKAELHKRNATRDAIVNRLDKLRPKDDTSSAIQAYFKAQDRKLEDRAMRQALIRESGLDLKQLAKDLKSPIDSAMARKAGRGSQRPTRI